MDLLGKLVTTFCHKTKKRKQNLIVLLMDLMTRKTDILVLE